MNSCKLHRLQATLVAIITITILHPYLTTITLLYPLWYIHSIPHIFYTFCGIIFIYFLLP